MHQIKSISLHTHFDEQRGETSMEISRINDFLIGNDSIADHAGIVVVTAFAKYSLKCVPLDEFR